MFFDTLFFAALTPLLPHYAHTLGLGKAGAGVLAAAYPAGAFLGAIPSGIVAARRRREADGAGRADDRRSSARSLFGLADSALAARRRRASCRGSQARSRGPARSPGSSPRLRRAGAGDPDRRAFATAVGGALFGPVLGGVASLAGIGWTFGVVGVASLGLVALGGDDALGARRSSPSRSGCSGTRSATARVLGAVLVRRPPGTPVRHGLGARAAAPVGTRLRRRSRSARSSSPPAASEVGRTTSSSAASPTGDGPLAPIRIGARRLDRRRGGLPVAERALRARGRRRLRRSRIRHVLHAGHDAAHATCRRSAGSTTATRSRSSTSPGRRVRRSARPAAAPSPTRRGTRCPTSPSRHLCAYACRPMAPTQDRPARRRGSDAGLERLVVAHHRRRLKRHGWQRAYDPPDDGLWCAGDPPPRDGNTVEVLVDGDEALPRLEDEIDARERVGAPRRLALPAVVPALARRPDAARAAGRDRRARTTCACSRGPARRCRSSRRRAPPCGPARESLVARHARSGWRSTRANGRCTATTRSSRSIDGRIAFVGGIDLTALAGDRLDSSEHPARGALGWHDAASGSKGRSSTTSHAHIALRWHEMTGEQLDRRRATTPRRRSPTRSSCARPERCLRRGAARRLPHPRGVRARAALSASG